MQSGGSLLPGMFRTAIKAIIDIPYIVVLQANILSKTKLKNGVLSMVLAAVEQDDG